MLTASLYLIVCSAKNRLRLRLRRLREPRYLVGAVVGVAYLYFTMFARMRGSRGGFGRRGGPASGPPAALAAIYTSAPALAGVLLLMLSGVSWILPFDSGLLDFSKAEVQFLFPAPVSRRQLLVHRLLRSQLGFLVGALLPAVFAPLSSGSSRVRVAVGLWLILVISKLYFTGVTLARTRLGSTHLAARLTAWAPLAATFAAMAVVAVHLARAFTRQHVTSLRDALVTIGTVSTASLPHAALAPFVAVTRPLFAPWPGAFLLAVGWALLVLAVMVVWVLASDEAFHDAAAEAAERRQHEPPASSTVFSARTTAWSPTLAATGRPEGFFVWKAAVQTLRATDPRALIRVAALIVAMTTGVIVSRRADAMTFGGMVATFGAVYAVVLGPQIFRFDIRQDLRHLELLKTWPIRSAAVVRGEILWPAFVVTALAWLAMAVALALTTPVLAGASVALRWGVAGAAVLLAPALILAQFTIHNGIALMFPGWVTLGHQRPRGLDAMGQRIVMLAGTLVLLILMALPGAVAGGVVWFAFRSLIGAVALIPAAAACATVMGVEVLIATEALGPLYERLDLSAVERDE